MEPAVFNGNHEINMDEANLEWYMDDFLALNGNTDTGNQNSGIEQVETADNTEENDLKTLEQNRKYILSEVEK
jgi:hypothetical protein